MEKENNILEGDWLSIENASYGSFDAEFFASNDDYAVIVRQGGEPLAVGIVRGDTSDIRFLAPSVESLVALPVEGKDSLEGQLLCAIVAEASRLVKSNGSVVPSSGVEIPVPQPSYFIDGCIVFSDLHTLQKAQRITCGKYREAGLSDELAVIFGVFPDGNIGNIILTIKGQSDDSFPSFVGEMRSPNGDIYSAKFDGVSKSVFFDDNHVMRLRVISGEVNSCFRTSLGLRLLAG